jgi:aminopeptidase N
VAGLLLALGAPRVDADAYPRQPIDVLHYDVEIAFSDAFAFEATTRVDVRLLSDATEVRLDFEGPTVVAVTAGGQPLPYRHDGGRLSVTLEPRGSVGQVLPLTVRYRGRPDGVSLVARPNAHGEPVLFGDNWPEGARHWLPSVDHPSDKATVDFAITADERFEAVAPGRLVEERELSGGRRLTRWSAPVAIPAYCMVVGLADFQVTRLGTADGIPLSLWVFAPDAGAATPMFARSVAMLEYFADLLGPYPYSKLAQVESTIRYSGMENASAIFYAEAELQGPNVDEFPVAHEIAHQWWGNSVTPADWDDLWLSEGFATYFDALFYEHIEGPEALRGRLRAGAERLVALDARRPGAIVDPEVTDPAEKLTPLVYQKGAWVLHMLRRRIGDERFFRGMREFYRQHAGGNATTADLQRVLEAGGGGSLEGFFRQWLRRAGMPELRVSWAWDEATGEAVVDVEQIQEGAPYDAPLDLAFPGPGGAERRTMALATAHDTARFGLPARPSELEVDPEGWLLHRATVVAPATTPSADRVRVRDTGGPGPSDGPPREVQR